jgi:hypothetical protein
MTVNFLPWTMNGVRTLSAVNLLKKPVENLNPSIQLSSQSRCPQKSIAGSHRETKSYISISPKFYT